MTASFQRILSLCAVAIVLATPRLAVACAVCLGGTGGGTARAFAIGTLFLSVLPLAMFGAIFFYLRRRAKQIEREAHGAAAERAANAAVIRAASR